MSIHVSKYDRSKFDKIKKEIMSLKKSYVKVGYLEGGEAHRNKDGDADESMAGIAAVHEYGAVISVTDKMRGYLHYIGIHLRKETDKIVIPERSFMRSWVAEKKEEITKVMSVLLKKVEEGGIETEEALNKLGAYGEAGMKDKIKSNVPPPLKFREGTALWDTGQLVNSIHHQAVKK